MSDTSIAIAQSLSATQTASTRQALQTEFVRQQAAAEQGLIQILQQSAEQLQAALPDGQGQRLDITA